MNNSDRRDAFSAETMRRTLDATLQPVRDQLALVDDEIARLSKELTAVRNVRQDLARVLRAADPDTPRPGIKHGQKLKTASGKGVSEERREAVHAWLLAHIRNGETFYASALVTRPDWDESKLGTQSNLAKSLNSLHDQGLITLDRLGKGGAKHFKLARGRS